MKLKEKKTSASSLLPTHSLGLSMIEIMVSVAILAIMAVLAVIFLQLQISRSRDARRKADLERIKIAFEEYYNDHGCYPDPGILNNCGGPELQPYLHAIPCDPWTNQPYLYVPDQVDACRAYRILTKLEDPSDPGIGKLECDGPEECNFGTGYNYGVSSGQPVKGDGSYVLPSPSPTPTPSATPTPPPSVSPSVVPTPSPAFYYACSPGNQSSCNIYHNPVGAGCPVTFQQDNCQNACGNPDNRCVN